MVDDIYRNMIAEDLSRQTYVPPPARGEWGGPNIAPFKPGLEFTGQNLPLFQAVQQEQEALARGFSDPMRQQATDRMQQAQRNAYYENERTSLERSLDALRAQLAPRGNLGSSLEARKLADMAAGVTQGRMDLEASLAEQAQAEQRANQNLMDTLFLQSLMPSPTAEMEAASMGQAANMYSQALRDITGQNQQYAKLVQAGQGLTGQMVGGALGQAGAGLAQIGAMNQQEQDRLAMQQQIDRMRAINDLYRGYLGDQMTAPAPSLNIADLYGEE